MSQVDAEIRYRQPILDWDNPRTVQVGFHFYEQNFPLASGEADHLTTAISGKYNLRELLQSPALTRLPAVGYATEVASQLPDVEIELNGIGQIGEYPEIVARHILTNTGNNLALHVPNKPEQALPTLLFISQLSAAERQRVTLNLYARRGKSPSNNLATIIEQAISLGLNTHNMRIGIEHCGPEWAKAAAADPNCLGEFLYEQTPIIELARDNNFKRCSMPETRGTLQPAQVYAYYRMQLDFMHAQGYTPEEVELHFHNDLGNAQDNYRAAILAIRDHNFDNLSDVRPIVDFTLAGMGERNGISRLDSWLVERLGLGELNIQALADWEVSQLGAQEMDTEALLSAVTAGTHADLIADHILAADILGTRYGSWDELITQIARLDSVSRSAVLAFLRSQITNILTQSYSEAHRQRFPNSDGFAARIVVGPTTGPKLVQIAYMIRGKNRVPSIDTARSFVGRIKNQAINKALQA